MTGAWWSYLALLLFVVVIISPAWAFAKVERTIEGTDIPLDAVMTHPSSRIALVGAESQLNRESHVLENLTQMIDRAPNMLMRGVWLKKREQYLKELRWRKIEEVCDGKSRVYL